MGMTHTIKDNFLAFKTSDQANISSLKAYFNPKQESIPTNGEIVPITGYNSISLVNLKKCIPVVPSNPQDIYYSNDNNYRIKYCGNNKFKLLDAIEGNSTAVFDIEIIPIIYKSEFNRLIGISTVKQKIDSWNFTYSLRTSDSSITKLNGYLDFGSSCQSLVTIIGDTSPFAGNTYDIIRVIFTSSILVDFEFSLVFTNSDDISMHNITFPAVGKNLLDKNTYSYKAYDSIIFGGTPTLSEPDGTLVLDAGTYTFSTSTNMTMLGMVHADGMNGGMGINTNYITFTCNTREKVRLMVLLNGQGQDHDMLQYNYQLEKGSTMTTYEPFNNTIYGGYINLITGQLIMDRALVTIDGTQTIQLRESFSTCQGFRVPKSALPVEADHFSIFDKANYMRVLNENEVVGNSPWTFYINTTNHALFFYLPLSYNTVSLAQQYLTTHPLQVCYTLLHPITYQFTPEQLETIKGENYFWSNTEGQVEITYQVHDSVDILNTKKKIIMNTPHIETKESEVINFNTDLTSKFNQLKVDFNPCTSVINDSIPSITNKVELIPYSKITFIKGLSKANIINVDTNSIDKSFNPDMFFAYDGNNHFRVEGRIDTGAKVEMNIDPIVFNQNENYQLIVMVDTIGTMSSDSSLNFQFRQADQTRIFTSQTTKLAPYTHSIGQITFDNIYTATRLLIGCTKGLTNIGFSIHLIKSESPVSYQTINLNNEGINDFYAGTIDILNNNITSSWKKVILNDPDKWDNSLNNTYMYNESFDDRLQGNAFSLKCEIAPNDPYADWFCRWRAINDQNFFCLKKKSTAEFPISFEELKQITEQEGFPIYYQLNTPIIYNFTNAPLKEWMHPTKGSNSYIIPNPGIIQLKYWTH